MKFNLAIWILQIYCYIVFPLLAVITGIYCLSKMHPMTILIGSFFLIFGLIEPILAKDIIFDKVLGAGSVEIQSK